MGEPVIDAETLLRTTRSVRRRLDLGRPVEGRLIEESLEVALQAPNGADTQSWRWIVVREPARRRRIGELYRLANERFAAQVRARADAGDVQAARKLASSGVFWEHLGEVPVLVVACFERQDWFDAASAYARASAYGSVFPAVWSFQLACRLRGLGSCLVTSQLHHAAEIAELLELPASFEQAALVAVAHLRGDNAFSQAPRRPLREVLRYDRWS